MVWRVFDTQGECANRESLRGASGGSRIRGWRPRRVESRLAQGEALENRTQRTRPRRTYPPSRLHA